MLNVKEVIFELNNQKQIRTSTGSGEQNIYAPPTFESLVHHLTCGSLNSSHYK